MSFSSFSALFIDEIKRSKMSTNTLWSSDRLSRLDDIEDILKRDLHGANGTTKTYDGRLHDTNNTTKSYVGRLLDTNGTTSAYIGRLDDIYPVATPVTQEDIKYLDDADQRKSYTNLGCLGYPTSSFDEAIDALKTQEIDHNNNLLDSSSLIDVTLSRACSNESISSEIESVYPIDLYSDLMETADEQECDTVMSDASLGVPATFSCTLTSDSENSNSTDKATRTPSSSYASSSQSISNVPAYNTNHSIDTCTAIQSNIKSIKTESCVHMPVNNLEIMSTPFKIISHRLHSGGEVSSYVISNPKAENSLIKCDVDTSSLMFKELLHSLSIASGYDHRMTQSNWMSQVALPEREMTSPKEKVTSHGEASMTMSQISSPIPATIDCDNKEDDKSESESEAYQEPRKSKTVKCEFSQEHKVCVR